MTIKQMLLLGVLVTFGAAPAFADCNSGEREVGYGDGNVVHTDCVEPASDMVPTDPDPEDNLSPSQSEEPNPNPSAGMDEPPVEG